MPLLIAVAVGVLLGDAFLHLIPDAMEMAQSSESKVALWVLIGSISFVFLESCLQWRHDHAITTARENQGEIASFAKMTLFGDGAHNFVDGVLIASSFLADPALGIATTIAIVLHEIPQEISDIAVLIQGGFSRRTAVLLNFFWNLGWNLTKLRNLLKISKFLVILEKILNKISKFLTIFCCFT